MIVPFNLNGKNLKADVEIDTLAVNLLRKKLGLLSIHEKCSDFSCCNCLIIVDDKPVLSCLVRVFALRHTNVWTYEGIKTKKEFLHIQNNTDFLCDLCRRARSLLIEALLRKKNKPDTHEIHHLANIIQCSCTSKQKFIEIIHNSVRQRKQHQREI